MTLYIYFMEGKDDATRINNGEEGVLGSAVK
jgi:hypothetical protein